jgi:hypothetical protein
MRAGDERQQIAKNARDSFDGLWNRFPTFWSADRQAQLKWLNTAQVQAHLHAE